MALKSIIQNTQNIQITEPNMPKSINLDSWGEINPTTIFITGYLKDSTYYVETSKIIDMSNQVTSESRKVIVINKSTGSVLSKY